jgi:elongation factor 1-alpha
VSFPPESEEGNVEYKLTLGSDVDRLAGQMRRLGGGLFDRRRG